MKALLFSEWAVIRASMRQYVVVTAVMAFVIAILSGNFGVEVTATVEEAASVIRTAVIPSVSIMLTFFVFFALFGADERDGWESVRLTLPVVRRQVVTARYIVMAATLGVTIVLSAFAGTLAGSLFAWSHYGVLSVPPLDEVLAVCVALLAVFSAYIAIQMPIFFRWGLAKARPYFNVPALVCLLLAVGPIRLAMDAGLVTSETAGVALSGTVGMTQLSTEVGVELGSALGSVWPLLVLMVMLCALVYLASIRISQRLYVSRDF